MALHPSEYIKGPHFFILPFPHTTTCFGVFFARPVFHPWPAHPLVFWVPPETLHTFYWLGACLPTAHEGSIHIHPSKLLGGGLGFPPFYLVFPPRPHYISRGATTRPRTKSLPLPAHLTPTRVGALPGWKNWGKKFFWVFSAF